MALIEVVCHQIGKEEFVKLQQAADRFACEFRAAGMEASTSHHCGDGRECDPDKEGVGARMSIRITTLGNETLGSFTPKVVTLLKYLGIADHSGTLHFTCLLDSVTEDEGEPASHKLGDIREPHLTA